MYRIKTDIRQYKCESIDKVEKLIRNWVIRPNDLIYSSNERDWLPIGEHPSFEKLFGILEEREAAEPDTVVTDDHPLLRNGVMKDDSPSEATQISERPEFDDDTEDALDSRETDIFDADQIADSLAERDRADRESVETDNLEESVDEAEDEPSEHDPSDESAEDDGTDDNEETDTDDDETSEPSESPESDAVDKGPEADDETLEEESEDEASFANDETLDEPAPLAPPEAPEGVEPPVNDEITVMTDKTLEMMKVDDDSNQGAGDDEETQITERPTASDDEDESTQVTERPTASDDDEPTQVAESPLDDETEQKVIVSAPDEPGTSKASQGVGRHDLPEEFFATNEISGPVFEESARVIDDLAAMEAERAAKGDIDDEWDAISDDLDAGPKSGALGLRDTDEISKNSPDETGGESWEAPASDDDEWEEEVAEVRPGDTPADVPAVGEFVNEGYDMPLPFAVGPDEKDVALGLIRSKKSRAEKIACFPDPKPKKRGEVHARVYYFSKTEPRDLSVPIVVGIFLLCALIVGLVGMC